MRYPIKKEYGYQAPLLPMAGCSDKLMASLNSSCKRQSNLERRVLLKCQPYQDSPWHRQLWLLQDLEALSKFNLRSYLHRDCWWDAKTWSLNTDPSCNWFLKLPVDHYGYGSGQEQFLWVCKLICFSYMGQCLTCNDSHQDIVMLCPIVQFLSELLPIGIACKDLQLILK